MEVGKVVWAKLATYAPWPAKIADLAEAPKNVQDALSKDETAGEERVFVWFFGSHDYNYVPRANVELWEDKYEERIINSKKGKNQKGWMKAVDEANKWIEDHHGASALPKSANKLRKEETTDDQNEEEEEEESDQSFNGVEKIPSATTPPKKESPPKKKRDSTDHPDAAAARSKTPEDSRKRASTNDLEKKEHKKVKPAASPVSGSTNASTSAEAVEKKLEVDKKKMNASSVSASLKTLAKHPVAKYFKYELMKYGEGTATAKAFIPAVRDNKEEVHSCLAAMHFLIDITAYAALVSLLHEGDSGFTQDIHVACLAPNIPLGEEVTITASSLPSKASHMLFASVAVHCNNRQILAATVTKSTAEYNFPNVHSREQQ